MADGMIRNTLVFRFPQGASNPSLVEMARFIKALDADRETMETSYKISDERCFCIKFKSERAMKDALLQNPECHLFQYSNGSTAEVRMGVMGGCQRYVRVFDLPPEVPDIDIALVLGKYGVVKRTVREKFPAELELDLYTGIRGVYMDVKKEIPAALYFLNRKGRIYYDGLKQKCFQCKKEGHLKVECPQSKKKHQDLETQQMDIVEPQTPGGYQRTVELIVEPVTPQGGQGTLYSDAVKDSEGKQGCTGNDITSPIVLNMTTLVSSKKLVGVESIQQLADAPTLPAPMEAALQQHGGDPDDIQLESAGASPARSLEEGLHYEVEYITPQFVMEGIETEGTAKRVLTSSDESANEVDTDGFTKVKGSKSKSKKLAGALEAIAADSTKQDNKPGGGSGGRSKTK